MTTNRLNLSGRIIACPEYSHEECNKIFYKTFLDIKRTSESIDTIPVIMSKKLIEMRNDMSGRVVEVSGYFRSFNQFSDEDNRSHLILNAYARNIRLMDADEEENENENQIFLDGHICKPPIYRKTPLGREITDIILAVNRSYKKTDYIPCIAWGKNAQKAARFGVGTHLTLNGRVQSREYVKQLDGNGQEMRTAYEVSIQNMELKNNGQ